MNQPISSPLGVQGVLNRIREIVPLLAREGARGEAERNVTDEAFQALRETGAFKVAIPRRFGGYESNMRTLLDVSSTIAEGDGGASWISTLYNIGAWIVSMGSERLQNEIFGANPNAHCCGVFNASPDVRKVEGGYRVSGRWFYASGVMHTDWCGGGIVVPDADGKPVDEGLAFFPRSECVVEDTWFTAGMRSSGSNSFVAKDLFVPEHRVLSMGGAMQGIRATPFTEETFYRAPFGPMVALVLVGPQLGLGRAALKMVRDSAASKAIAYTSYQRQADAVPFQLALSRATSKIDTAHLHAYRAADDIDRYAASGEPANLLARARVRADCAVAVESVVEAINALLFAHGAASFAERSPLQRIWRDSATAARHAVLLPDVSHELYGKALLGLDNTLTPIA